LFTVTQVPFLGNKNLFSIEHPFDKKKIALLCSWTINTRSQ
jgi:hypothetical protein